MRTGLLALALLFASAGIAQASTIYLDNQSTTLSDKQLANALPALQAQLDQDFQPVWGMSATLVIGTAPDRAWRITLRDESGEAGALGYHDVCQQDGLGYPCGFVGVQTSLDDEADPISVLDHELLEMIADPYTSTFVKVGRRFYIQEVCDAPEAEAFSYTRPGLDGTPVTLSDFVTPVFFRPGHAGPYDFTGHISKPLEVLPGGYISWWDNGWHQVMKHLARGRA